MPLGVDPFSNPAFMPHGHCYLWEPAILWIQVVANSLIGLTYYSIPIALWFFVSRRTDLKDLQVKGLFIMFALFILACGTTHFLDILVIWRPYYWLDSIIRIITGILSVATAVVLWPLIPRLLSLPSPSQLRAVNAELEAEVKQRRAREEEIRALNADLEQRVAERTRELIQRTQEAEVANRSKSIFLATMSHELRTPLNAIIGYSELMLEDIADQRRDDIQQHADLEHVRSSASHLLALINEVLDFSKLEANKMEILPAPFSAEALLKSVAHTVEPLAAKSNNRLEVDVKPSEHELVSDAHRIRQILFNLLSNACKFTHQGLIRIEFEVVDQEACFRIRDSGIGIREEHLEHIFDMFYQVDSSYSRKYMGTGLGLTIAKGLAEKLDGRLEVSSRLGEGTVFSLYLPLQPPDRLTQPAGATVSQVS